MQIPIWYGQLALSIFLRVAKEGPNLFIESSTYLLPPLHSLYSEVDTFTQNMGVRQTIYKILRMVGSSAFSWVNAIVWILRKIDLQTLWILETEGQKVRRNSRYDYGTDFSFRERWADQNLYRYFQRSDQIMYANILRECLLEAIADSLESKGISTEKLREQTKTILNQGLIISGGTVNAENLAVGANATIQELLERRCIRQNGRPSTRRRRPKRKQQKSDSSK